MKQLAFFLLLMSTISYAQKPHQDAYTVYINYPAYSIRAEVSAMPLKLSPKQELDYYWYASNKIIHTQGGCDGKILNGQYTSFYLSNNLKDKGSFKNGLKNGLWCTWYENGKMSETTEWKNGLKNGEFMRFGEAGDTLLEEHYKNGYLHGNQRSYAAGKLITEKKYRNGKEILPKKKTQKNSTTEQTSKTHPLKSKLKTLFKPKKKEIKPNNTKSTKAKKEKKEQPKKGEKNKSSEHDS